jgi:hypothetical protein
MPGYERRSVGLHGDDGAIFQRSIYATVFEFSPVWQTGDVVGCGFDRAAGLVFFVLNVCRLPAVLSQSSPLFSVSLVLVLRPPS